MIDDLLAKLGYKQLNEMQRKVTSEGLLDRKRAVLCSPTASGKTLIAMLAIAKCLDENAATIGPNNEQRKAIYVVPLRALAREKYTDFTKRLAAFNAKVAVSIGNLDEDPADLMDANVIVVTSEKLDSLLRHDSKWSKNIALAVFDECHLIGDETRGPTMEIVMTKIRNNPESKIVALSATVPNAFEIAKWLEGELFISTFRPTELVMGVNAGTVVKFKEDRMPLMQVAEKTRLPELVTKALSSKEKAQALVFVATRRSTQTSARELAGLVEKTLTPAERISLKAKSDKALRALATPTDQCTELAYCLERGVAFHHAGIEDKQRELIELGYKHDRDIKLIVCTTTLAMGIDYPASWVIVKDLKRFNGGYSDFIPNIEVQQMVGRAGRPSYDDKGIAILMANKAEGLEAWDKYVYGPLENIYSQLSSEPAMRMHLLSLVACGECNSFESLFDFFQKTFYGYQYGDTKRISEIIERTGKELIELDFIRERQGKLVATPTGKRVSELYIDPLTAASFVAFTKKQAAKKPNTSGASNSASSAFEYLFTLSSANEMRPLMNVKRDEEKALWEEAYNVLDELPEWDQEVLQKYKTAKVLNAWINEATEQEILKQFDLPPGVLHARMRNAEWLAYSLRELAFIENQTTAFKQARIMQRRIKKGIKEELMPLCSIRGIGRVKARRLFNKGVKTIDDYAKLTKDDVKAIVKNKTMPNQQTL